MTLEIALEKTTATLERLIAVLTEALPQPITVNIGDVLPAENTAPIAAETAEKPKRAKKEAATVVPAGEPVLGPSAPSPAAGAVGASATEAAAAPVVEPTYAEAAAAVTSVVKAKGTQAAKSVLQAFGAEKLPGIAPERYGEVIAACRAVLA